MFLRNPHIIKSGLRDTEKLHLTKDSCIRKAGPPVPAEHAVGFPESGAALHRIGAVHGKRIFFVGIINIVHRRPKNHAKLVSLGFQKLLHIKLPLPVHVFRVAEMGSVEINFSQCVNAVKMKHRTVCLPKRFFRIKGGGKLKILFHQVQRFFLVIPVKRIIHLPRIEISLVNASRNLRRNPVIFLEAMHLPSCF